MVFDYVLCIAFLAVPPYWSVLKSVGFQSVSMIS